MFCCDVCPFAPTCEEEADFEESLATERDVLDDLFDPEA